MFHSERKVLAVEMQIVDCSGGSFSIGGDIGGGGVVIIILW